MALPLRSDKDLCEVVALFQQLGVRTARISADFLEVEYFDIPEHKPPKPHPAADEVTRDEIIAEMLRRR